MIQSRALGGRALGHMVPAVLNLRPPDSERPRRLPAPLAWIERARCREPEARNVSFDWPDSSLAQRDRAIAICAACPVIAECLEASDAEEGMGRAGLATIRGGLTPRQRWDRRHGRLNPSGVSPQPSPAEVAEALAWEEERAEYRRKLAAAWDERKRKAEARRARERALRDRAGIVPRMGAVFSTAQVGAMTGASAAQLRHWDRIGVVRPSVQSTGRRPGRPRLYSRADVAVIEEVLVWVRAGHRVSYFPDRRMPASAGGRE